MRPGSRATATASLAALLLVSSAAAQDALPDTLDLDRALDLALTANPALARARSQAGAAGADRQAALGAFLPTASASMGLSRSNFTRNTFLSPEGETQTLEDPLSSSNQGGSQSLSFGWTVFDLGRIAGFRESGAAVRASQRRLDDQRLTVIAEVRRNYLEALRRQRLLELTRRQIRDRELELDIARRRYEIAAVERSDVLGAETLLLNAEVSLLNETSQLESGLRALSVSMGLPAEAGPGTTLVDILDLPPATALDSDGLVGYALNEDPELRALEADRAAADASLWGARSTFLPTIQLGLNLSRSQSFGPDADFFQFDFSDTQRGFSVSASWTLFDGFNRTAQTRNASARKFQASESLRQRRLEIAREVRRFVQEIEQLGQALSLLERALQISEERLAMTRTRYQNGTEDFTALQQAIGSVTSAERSLIEQRYNYLLAWTNLEEYVGDAR